MQSHEQLRHIRNISNFTSLLPLRLLPTSRDCSTSISSKCSLTNNYATSAIFQIPLPYFLLGYSRQVGIVPLAFLRNAVSRTITPHPQYFKFHFPTSSLFHSSSNSADCSFTNNHNTSAKGTAKVLHFKYIANNCFNELIFLNFRAICR